MFISLKKGTFFKRRHLFLSGQTPTRIAFGNRNKVELSVIEMNEPKCNGSLDILVSGGKLSVGAEYDNFGCVSYPVLAFGDHPPFLHSALVTNNV